MNKKINVLLYVVSGVLFSISLLSYGFSASFSWLKITAISGAIMSSLLFVRLTKSVQDIGRLLLFPANLFFMIVAAYTPTLQKEMIFNQSNVIHLIIVFGMFIKASLNVVESISSET